jgi:hypothetical protein
VHINSGKVTLDVDTSLYDIYNTVWSLHGEHDCDDAPKQIGNGACTAKFECHGDDSWATTNGMSSSLVNIIGKAKSASSTKDIPITPQCLKEGWIGQSLVCLEWGPNSKTVTVVPEMVQIYAQMDPPAGVDCNFCKTLALELGAASLAPEWGVAFGVAGLVEGAGCASQGCWKKNERAGVL